MQIRASSQHLSLVSINCRSKQLKHHYSWTISNMFTRIRCRELRTDGSKRCSCVCACQCRNGQDKLATLNCSSFKVDVISIKLRDRLEYCLWNIYQVLLPENGPRCMNSWWAWKEPDKRSREDDVLLPAVKGPELELSSWLHEICTIKDCVRGLFMIEKVWGTSNRINE